MLNVCFTYVHLNVLIDSSAGIDVSYKFVLTISVALSYHSLLFDYICANVLLALLIINFHC